MRCFARHTLLLPLALVAACAGVREKGGLVAHPELSPGLIRTASSRRLALLIGVDRPADRAWSPLRFAAKDAQDLAQALRDPEIGRFETEVLTAQPATTRASVRAALERLSQRNTSADDIVLVYFSGHGSLGHTPGSGLSRYLVASDTLRRDVAGTGLEVEEVRGLFEGLRSRRKVMVLAACHSGTGKSLLPEEVERELRGLKGGSLPRPLSEVSRAVMTLSASAWGEAAREDDALQNDIYTHFFIEALKERKDRNRDGAVSAEEAHDYAREKTYYYTSGQQTPSAESAVVGMDPVVLAGEISLRGLPEIGTYDEAWSGAEVSVDGAKIGALPGSLVVAPGRHRVTVLKGGATLAETTLSMDEGERFDVAALVARSASSATVDARVGYHVLLSGGLRRQLGGPVALGGLAVRLPALVSGRFDLAADLAFGGARTHIAPDGLEVPVSLSLTEIGAAVQYPFPVGRLLLAAGPRLSLMYLRRSYALPGFRGADDALLTVPGLALDSRLRLGDSFEWTAGARLSYAAMSVDGATTHLGAASLWTGIGYGF